MGGTTDGVENGENGRGSQSVGETRKKEEKLLGGEGDNQRGEAEQLGEKKNKHARLAGTLPK